MTPRRKRNGNGLRAVMAYRDLVMIAVIIRRRMLLMTMMAMPMRVCVPVMRVMVGVIILHLMVRIE